MAFLSLQTGFAAVVLALLAVQCSGGAGFNCYPEQFQCDDTSCVGLNEFCDGRPNCNDRSDQGVANCKPDRFVLAERGVQRWQGNTTGYLSAMKGLSVVFCDSYNPNNCTTYNVLGYDKDASLWYTLWSDCVPDKFTINCATQWSENRPKGSKPLADGEQLNFRFIRESRLLLLWELAKMRPYKEVNMGFAQGGVVTVMLRPYSWVANLNVKYAEGPY